MAQIILPKPMESTTQKLHIADCADLSFIPDGSVHCIVTSPPYPMVAMWDELFSRASPDAASALNSDKGNEAFEAMNRVLDRVWQESFRVLASGGFLCVNIGDATRSIAETFQLYSNHTRITTACMALGFDVLPIILWWKPTNAPNKFMGSGMLPAGAYVTLEHEFILIFRKGGKREFKSEHVKARRQDSALFWEERNIWFSDRWDLKGVRQLLKGDEARERSAAFPFELAYRLINMYSVKGDTVLDPFLGTGTTMFAALASGRNSVGVEIDGTFETSISDRMSRCASGINAYVEARLARHKAFVAERLSLGKEIKHTSAVYGFPVMTGQEEALKLEFVKEIRQGSGSQWQAVYADDNPEGGQQISLF